MLFALASVACLLAAACSRPAAAPQVGGPLLPELVMRQDQVELLQLRGAGGRTLVTLRRIGDEWRLAERDGWRGDGARIGQYLAQLAQARRAEAKTDSPAMYPRIAVEDVSDPQAGGTELEVSGRGIHARLLLGKAHGPGGGRFVRLSGQARAWLCDLDVGFDADPVAWLDHRLAAVPLARVQQVRIRPYAGPAYALVNRDDRFGPDDAPAEAMRDSHAGDDIAGAIAAFDIEDVAADDGPPRLSQQLDYELVGGEVLSVSVWRDGLRDWARLSASFDQPRAAAWASRARRPALEAQARAQVAEWSRRFAGRKFLLPPALAHTLTLDHSQILEGAQSP